MKPQKLFYILLAIWVLADLLQAIFTPVHADEAYYALYGRFLDWGYYDHPPMVRSAAHFSREIFPSALPPCCFTAEPSGWFGKLYPTKR